MRISTKLEFNTVGFDKLNILFNRLDGQTEMRNHVPHYTAGILMFLEYSNFYSFPGHEIGGGKSSRTSSNNSSLPLMLFLWCRPFINIFLPAVFGGNSFHFANLD